MQNHLIIGLGGTGGKIIRALRKQIYQTLRQEDPDNVNLRYLYVDSDDALMKSDAPSWKTLGRSVQLPKKSQLLIRGMGLDGVIDELQSHPSIRPWIGSRAIWDDILRSAKGAQIAGGQKRRLGRFLFANKVGAFNAAVGELVNEMTQGGQSEVAFHICCGLAGGTGSGTVVDVVSQLRSVYGPGSNVRITIYALLPERLPNPTWAGGNYHANGYAALRELNALSVDRWRPHDLSGRKQKSGGLQGREAERLDLQDPFNGCYIFTDENAAGYRVDVNDTLPEIVASFLYHKTVTLADVDSGDITFRRQENYEISSQDVAPEREVSGGPAARTKRFTTFGIKTLTYPEEEIFEYLTFAFAEQAALQLRFNHWVEGVGYTDEPRRQSFDGYIRNKETQNRWRISDAHLTLNEGILDDERENGRWKPFDAEWNTSKTHTLAFVHEESDKKVWADRLGQMLAQRFESGFRKQGVQTFYSQRDRLRKDYVAHVRGLVERELFERWTTADLSMDEIGQMLADLGRELDERHKALDGKIVQQNEIADAHWELGRANDIAWSRVGVVRLPGTYERLLNEKAVNLEQHYLARTRATAYEFAKRLLGSLREEIAALRSDIELAAATLSNAVDRFRAESAARLVDVGEDDTEAQTVRFYDPGSVRALSNRLVRDEDTQRTQTARMRQHIVDTLDTVDPTFAHFNRKADLSTLVDTFAEQAAANAQAAHDTARDADDAPLLGVSILDKLYERFGNSDEQLRGYFERLVRQARSFATLDDTEVAKDVPSRATSSATLAVILPDFRDRPEFGERLVRALRGAVPAGVADTVEIVTSPARKNEIVILNVVSSVPARMLAPVAFLKERYEARLLDGPRAALEMHLEGDGSDLPDLFHITEPGWSLAYLLVAEGIELFKAVPDEAGRESLVYEVFDEDGFLIETVPLGATILDAADGMSLALAHTIRTAVEGRLDSSEYTPLTARQGVFEAVKTAVGTLRQSANGHAEALGDAGREAKRILKLA